MRPADIGGLVEVSDPRVSPDGRTVAFVVTTVDLDANRYRGRVWLAAADGSEPPRPFTAGEHRDGRPRWSPDGRELAFVSHREGHGSELYVLPVAGGGEVRRAASWYEEIEELAWSPDGRRLAFTARQRDDERDGTGQAGDMSDRTTSDRDRPPRRIDRLAYRFDGMGWTCDRPRQLFTVRADGNGRPAAVTSGPFDLGGVAWSPDGASLAFAAGRHETWDRDRAVDLFSVGAGGGEPQRLTATGPTFRGPSWSPDGSTIAFVWGDPRSLPRSAQVGTVPRSGGDHRLLTTALDRNCAPFLIGAREPVWDGADLLFQVEDAGNLHLYRVDAGGTGKPDSWSGATGGSRASTSRAARSRSALRPPPHRQSCSCSPAPTSAG